MKLAGKIEVALALIVEQLSRSLTPVVLSSFGKDSMVLLDLIRRAGFKLPVVFFREPFFPLKYAFANRVIEANNYTVYDYPAVLTQVAREAGNVEIINYHQAGDTFLYLPTGIRAPEPEQPFLCGLNDLYLKPLGSFNFPWDTLFIGHKSSDVDPIFGEIPLRVSVKPGNPTLVFPLEAFTDEDVWAYTEQHGLPINDLRYNRANGWKEHDDITFNPDYLPACTACMDPEAVAEVRCMKTGEMVPNVSARLQFAPKVRPTYLAEVG